METNNLVKRVNDGYTLKVIELNQDKDGGKIINSMYDKQIEDLQILKKYIELRPEEKFFLSKSVPISDRTELIVYKNIYGEKNVK